MSLPTSITGHADPAHRPSRHLRQQIILITGANTGLGFEAAVKYAQKGCAKLILAVRSVQKGEEAKTRFLQCSGRREGQDFVVKVLGVDVADFESIKTFASDLEKEIGSGRLDIVLINAGLANPT